MQSSTTFRTCIDICICTNACSLKGNCTDSQYHLLLFVLRARTAGMAMPAMTRCAGWYLLQPLEGPHGADCVALHQDVAVCQELKGLQGSAIGPQQSLAPLHEFLLCTNRKTLQIIASAQDNCNSGDSQQALNADTFRGMWEKQTLFRTRPPILMTSHCISSFKIFMAYRSTSC